MKEEEKIPSDIPGRLPPRRFQFWDLMTALWIYGAYFPTSCVAICEDGRAYVGIARIERKTFFKWIDNET